MGILVHAVVAFPYVRANLSDLAEQVKAGAKKNSLKLAVNFERNLEGNTARIAPSLAG